MYVKRKIFEISLSFGGTKMHTSYGCRMLTAQPADTHLLVGRHPVQPPGHLFHMEQQPFGPGIDRVPGHVLANVPVGRPVVNQE